jgi:Rhamnogalacturonan I lyases beta-sheet domain
MSEATDHQQEEFTDLEPDYPPPSRRSRMWRVLDTRLGRLAVLAVVLVLIGGGLAWWASLGAARLTSGTALPDSNVMVDTGTDSTSTLTPSAGPLAMPASLTAAMVGTAVHVSWQPGAATDQVAQYVVYRNGVKLAAVTNATTYQDTTVVVGTKYGYQVQAVNAAGTGSPLSPMVSITVPAAGSGAGGAPPPAAPLPPMPTGWPSASSTGASGSLASVSGDVVLSSQGEVYTNKRIKGTLTVTACNVTIRNVEVDSGEPFTGNNTPDLFAIWLQESASCGVTVDHVSTITASAPNVYVTTSIRIARGGPVTITNSKMLGAQLGILGVSAGVVRGNYIELGANMRGDHNDAIQGDGATNLTIDHNTLLNPNDQTSALALYTEFGNNNNITVSGNLMAGGGFTCYCGDGKSDNNGNAARAVNVNIINNVFWRKYFPDAGHFGSGRAYNPAGGGRWVGNVYMSADGTVTTQSVPQPSIDQ